jgi:zinc transporter ZupT
MVMFVLIIGYINGWAAVSKDLSDKLTIFINLGIILGYLLGLIVKNNLIIVALPCFCCGLMMYSSTLVCLPNLYSNGENHIQDKFRYGSIFTALLLTVVYHPLCYLLRV